MFWKLDIDIRNVVELALNQIVQIPSKISQIYNDNLSLIKLYDFIFSFSSKNFFVGMAIQHEMES